MTLTIITGTHTFIDLTGRFKRAYIKAASRNTFYNINGIKFHKKRFERVEITKECEVIRQPSRIFPGDRAGFSWSISQPTGSGKTILGAYHLLKTFRNGGNIAGNLSFAYFKQNRNKPPEAWQPNINSIDDLIEAKNTRLLIDDIKGTIERWQAHEADIVSMVANLGRKGGVDMDITTQRVINYIPPNIRAVATGYEIPYITIRDQRIETPDHKGYPVEMEIISLIPADSGDIFIGFGTLNGDIPDNKIITPTPDLLNCYRTMEISRGLRSGPGSGANNRPGLDLELEALKFLTDQAPGQAWKHLNGKNVFDIVGDLHAFDIVGQDDDGDLYTRHKNLLGHIRTANKKGLIPYLMFKYKGSWGFVKINSRLAARHKGDKIDTYNLQVRTLDKLKDDC